MAGSLRFHPAFRGPVRYTIEPRPQPEDDETSTAQTIARMAQLARKDATHPDLRQAAYLATAAAAGDARQEAAAIHAWIRGRVRFVDDSQLAGFRPAPADAEVLVRPIDLLAMPDPQGDCDDSSMLCAAMLRAVGIPAGFKTVAANPRDPEVYSHVYTVALLPDGPLPLDCSTQRGVDPRPGWEVRAAGKNRLWPLEEQNAMLRGLGFEYSPPPVGGQSPWWGLVNSGINTAGTIFAARYGKPELEPGESMRTSQGEYSRTGYGIGAGSSSGLLLIGGLVLAAVVLMSMSRRGN